mgnify:CR=1 FL=1
MKTVFDLSRDEIVALTDEDISLYIDKELANKGIPIEAKNWNIKNKSRVSKNWSSGIYVKRYRHRF